MDIEGRRRRGQRQGQQRWTVTDDGTIVVMPPSPSHISSAAYALGPRFPSLLFEEKEVEEGSFLPSPTPSPATGGTHGSSSSRWSGPTARARPCCRCWRRGRMTTAATCPVRRPPPPPPPALGYTLCEHMVEAGGIGKGGRATAGQRRGPRHRPRLAARPSPPSSFTSKAYG